MGYWKVIIPTTTSNYVLNPSAGTTENFAAIAGATVTRVNSTETPPPLQTCGRAGYKVVIALTGDGIALTTARVLPDDKVISFHLYSPGHAYSATVLPPLRCTIDGGTTWVTPELVMQVSEDWYWFQMLNETASVALSFTLSIESTVDGPWTFYIDSIMVANAYGSNPPTNYPLTYVDGDQDGCVWTGTPHASRSKRMNVMRSGGVLLDLEDDLHFDTGAMIGAGAATHTISTEGMALLPGAQVAGEKLERRSFAIGGIVRGTSQADFHANKQDLLSALSSQIVPEQNGQKQPVRLWYTAARPVRYIEAYYEGGLEGNLNARTDPCYWEQNIALQFMAVNPLWKSVIERSLPLNAITSAVAYCTAARWNWPGPLKTYFGAWTNFYLGGISAGISGFTVIRCAAWGPDGKLYIGGDFTDLNGTAALDYIARYDPFTNAWEEVANGPLNAGVYAMAFGPDGTLYIGGLFTDAGGDGNADYLASCDPDAAVPVWAAVGTGGNTSYVQALCFDRVGNLIIGGSFTNWGGVGDADYAIYWDGAAYQLFSTDQFNGDVYAVAASPDGWIYFGGAFTEADNDLNYVARIKIGMADYEPLDAGGEGVDDVVHALAIDGTGRRVWLGGQFHASTGGVTLNHIGLWNGSQFEALSSGVGDVVRALALGPDDALWAGGHWTSITGMGACSGIAKWVGGSWCPVDVQFSPVPHVFCIAIGAQVPPTSRNYNVALGFNMSPTMYYPNVTMIDTEGTWLAFPKVVFRRSTAAVSGRLGNVRIGPTGSELYLNYTMLPSEILTIDTEPQKKTVVSNFYGQRADALLPPSDLGSFALLPPWEGIQTDVYWFAEASGDTDLYCYLVWRETFESQD